MNDHNVGTYDTHPLVPASRVSSTQSHRKGYGSSDMSLHDFADTFIVIFCIAYGIGKWLEPILNKHCKEPKP